MTAEIADGFFATSTEQEGLDYAGHCPFGHTRNNTDRMFSEMPSVAHKTSFEVEDQQTHWT